MRPSSWAEYTMMVREITGLDDDAIFERYPRACGLHAAALWWQSKRCTVIVPGAVGKKAAGLDSVL